MINWKKIGLTVGMDENKIPKLEELCNKAAEILTSDIEEETESLGIDTMAFPIIYRVVRDTNIDDVVTAEEIINTIKDNLSILIDKISKEPNAEETDIEAEAAKRICDIIIENIKNKRI